MSEWETITTPEVCPDCIAWLANGDLSALDLLPAGEAAARGEAVRYGARLLVAGWELYADVHADPVGPDDDGDGPEPSFSWQRCAGCGDGHGGDRYPVTVSGWRVPLDRDDRAGLWAVQYVPHGNANRGAMFVGYFSGEGAARRAAAAWSDGTGSVYVGRDGAWTLHSTADDYA